MRQISTFSNPLLTVHQNCSTVNTPQSLRDGQLLPWTPQSLRDSQFLPCFRGGAAGGGVFNRGAIGCP